MIFKSRQIARTAYSRKTGQESAHIPPRTGLAWILDMHSLNLVRIFRWGIVVMAISSFSACKLPEQRQAAYPNGFLKERYWVYREGGHEVMNGLYTSWFPNGEREVEILYRDGSEVMKTYFSEHGSVVGTVGFASLREP